MWQFIAFISGWLILPHGFWRMRRSPECLWFLSAWWDSGSAKKMDQPVNLTQAAPVCFLHSWSLNTQIVSDYKHTHQYVLISFDKVVKRCNNLHSRLCFLKVSVHCPVLLLQRRWEFSLTWRLLHGYYIEYDGMPLQEVLCWIVNNVHIYFLTSQTTTSRVLV